MNNEEVILVNEQDEQTGTIEKMEAHRKALYTGLSAFLYSMGKVKCFYSKEHWENIIARVCGPTPVAHPRPGEEVETAALRRLKEEMGIETSLKKIFDFIYRTDFDNGLTEYEFDHVYIGDYPGLLEPDKREVKDYCFRTMEDISQDLIRYPEKYSSWFKIAFPLLRVRLNA